MFWLCTAASHDFVEKNDKMENIFIKVKRISSIRRLYREDNSEIIFHKIANFLFFLTAQLNPEPRLLPIGRLLFLTIYSAGIFHLFGVLGLDENRWECPCCYQRN